MGYGYSDDEVALATTHIHVKYVILETIKVNIVDIIVNLVLETEAV